MVASLQIIRIFFRSLTNGVTIGTFFEILLTYKRVLDKPALSTIGYIFFLVSRGQGRGNDFWSGELKILFITVF